MAVQDLAHCAGFGAVLAADVSTDDTVHCSGFGCFIKAVVAFFARRYYDQHLAGVS